MKKLLFILLVSIASYGQTYQNPTFGTVKTKTAPTVTTTPHLGTVETDGTISKITPANLPISTATQTAIDAKVGDFINDGATTLAPSMNAVYDALQLKENSANKSDSYTVSSSTTYASTKAVVDGLSTKQNTLTNPVTGTGTTNYLSKFTGSGTLGNSLIYDNGTHIGIGTSTVNYGGFGRALTVQAGSGYAGLEVYGSATTQGGQLDIGAGGVRYATFSGEHQSTDNGRLVFRTRRDGVITEAMRIHSTGNLTVGTITNNGNIGRFAGTVDVNKLQLNTTPATASGTPPLLTWNSTTKDVESVPYAAFAPTASPSFTGTPTAPTATAGTNTTQIATTAFVKNAVDNRWTITGGLDIYATDSNSGNPYTERVFIGTSAPLISNAKFQVNGNIYSNAFVYGSSFNSSLFQDATAGTKLQVISGSWVANKQILAPTLNTTGYTVATLPTGVTGATTYVTDAISPTYLGTLTGGGSVVCPVFYNGTAWVSH